MSTIQDIKSAGISLLNNLIRDNNNIKIKVPQVANPSIFANIFPTKALISGITLSEMSSINNSTADTLVCKLVVSDLKLITNCPYSDFMSKGIVIEYKNKTYSIIKDLTDDFDTMLILYLNKKGT